MENEFKPVLVRLIAFPHFSLQLFLQRATLSNVLNSPPCLDIPIILFLVTSWSEFVSLLQYIKSSKFN